MPLEVDYITMGEAAERIGKPAATLRHWTDQLEEFKVHYVLRNNRNERIYEESDLKIFAFLRDLKEEYGRKTTSKDLSYLIEDKGKSGELQLRSREDAPPPNPSNRTTDLLNQADLKQLMESDRAMQVLNHMVLEATSHMKEKLIEEVRAEMMTYDNGAIAALQQIEERKAQREEQRHKEQMEYLKNIEEGMKRREERDREERLAWQKEQEVQRKIEEEAKKVESEKPKTWFQKLLGQ